MKLDLEKDSKVYTLTFDEYDELDTVECNGKFLSTKNRVVKSIVANLDTIYRGGIPKGFTKPRR